MLIKSLEVIPNGALLEQNLLHRRGKYSDLKPTQPLRTIRFQLRHNSPAIDHTICMVVLWIMVKDASFAFTCLDSVSNK